MSRRMPRGALAGLAAVLAGLALQGCEVEELSKVAAATSDAMRECGATTEECSALPFEGGVVNYVGVNRGDAAAPSVTCAGGVNFTYQGPTLECGWVALACVASSPEELRTELCFRVFNVTLNGTGLRSWPEGRAPQLLDPASAPEPYRSRYFNPQTVSRRYWAIRNATGTHNKSSGGSSDMTPLLSGFMSRDAVSSRRLGSEAGARGVEGGAVQPIVPLVDPRQLKCGPRAGAAGASAIRFFDVRAAPGAQHGAPARWAFLALGLASLAALAAAAAARARRSRRWAQVGVPRGGDGCSTCIE